jgi:flagellar biosynthesis protein FlhB
MADSESGQDRTLDPTAKRYADARLEGQVPRSRDLAHFIVVGSAVAVLALAGGSLATASRALLTRGLRFDAATATEPARMAERLGELVSGALVAVAPVFAVMLVAAIASPLLIGGSSSYFIGNAIYDSALNGGNLPFAAALAFVSIVIMALYLFLARLAGAFEAL